MPALKQFVSSLRQQLLADIQDYTPTIQSTIISLAMATFGKTRFASHIKFISLCLRQKIVPNGFRMKFHGNTVTDGNYNYRTNKALFDCSRKLMRSTVSSMTKRKDQYDRQMKDFRVQLSRDLPDSSHPRLVIHTLNRSLHQFLCDTKDSKLQRLSPAKPVRLINNHNHKLVVTIPPDLPLSDDERDVLGKGLNFLSRCNNLSMNLTIARTSTNSTDACA